MSTIDRALSKSHVLQFTVTCSTSFGLDLVFPVTRVPPTELTTCAQAGDALTKYPETAEESRRFPRKSVDCSSLGDS